VGFPFDGDHLEGSKLKQHPGFGGILAFQSAIVLAVEVWETEWNKVLDGIDGCLSVQLDQTLNSKQITKWMFDLDFRRSRLYFTVLQILRIFGESIRTASADLKTLDSLFSTRELYRSGWPPSDDELLAFSSNWESITEQQKKAEETLLRRILDKTEEVKSLRDGVQDNYALLKILC
jgi:hypothetical protein